ncbi:MAG: hypothetical protein AAFW84_13850 [Cyanobacteria bacterium J06635_15]
MPEANEDNCFTLELGDDEVPDLEAEELSSLASGTSPVAVRVRADCNRNKFCSESTALAEGSSASISVSSMSINTSSSEVSSACHMKISIGVSRGIKMR